MGRKVSIGVGVLLLLCAFGRGLTYDQCDVLLSTVGTFEWTYGAPCSGMTYTIPGSAFYRREVLFGTDCMVGHFESYIRSPGENFLTNLTGYTSGGFKLTAAAGYDIRLRLSHSSDRCFPRLLSARYYFAGEQVIGAWNAVQISKAINADTEKCANGGFRTHDTSDSCFCLPGFSGPTCTQACGWNKIGASCELTCSDERRGCRGSVFCDAIFGSSCSCASGFQGPDCSLNCGPKLYGANCLQPCGMCVKGGSCDPITGHCLEDCEPGYLRPFCHEKLTHLRSPPHIFEVGATSLNGSFPTTSQETLGRGSVLFYQPQYKVQSIPESNWVSSSLGRYIPDGNEGIQVFEMDNLPPNSDLIVRILLLDQEMRAYDSPPFVPVRTGGRSRVENLKLADVSGRSANLTWSSHDFKMGDYFFVRHECLSMVGCPGPCPHRGGIVTAATTSITLQELLPAATYRVTVEAADNHKQAIIFTTNLLSPDASVSSLRVSARTNSSALLEWGPSDQCEWVFGPVALYAWSLQPLGSKAGTATVANTTATSTVLTGLQPLANYQFSVNLFNTEGKSPESRIATLNFSTHHTVPDPPRDLTAYRLNRTAVWLRWRAPSRPSGTLRAYIIDTTPLKEKGDASWGPPRLVRSERLPVGSHCGGYPEFVCFTVARLRPQSRYTMTVSAVNEHGDKPGEPASVEATTIKGVSEPPQDLRVVSQGKNHAVLAWGLPYKINGDLTFFEVAVVRHVRADEESAETDVPDPDVERITVGKEQPQYEYRVEGLQPGATYAISVNCGRYGKASHLEVTTDDNDEAV